jgi:hypothetical protein
MMGERTLDWTPSVRPPVSTNPRHNRDLNKMTKPLGYYANVTSGDCSFLDELQERYGSTFSRLNRLEKLYILSAIISNLTTTQTRLEGRFIASQALATVIPIIEGINKRLLIGEHLGLAEAIINQLKHQY